MNSLTFTLTGEVNVQITITEQTDGGLKFDLLVLDDTGAIGDLTGLFFDVADDSLVDGLSVEGDQITDEAFKSNSITKVSGGTNVNGEIVNTYGKFDGGIKLGSDGIGTDDIRETSFVLSHDSADLSLADIALQDFAARLTSVGEEGGSREDSLKLGGTSPEVPPEGPVNEAIDDVLTVLSSETAGDFDFLDSGASSILENDLSDGAAYGGDVIAINGDETAVETIVAGSAGGLMFVYADGSVDFDANGQFDYLFEGEVAQTEFTYAIEGDAEATITVNVIGEEDDTGVIL